MPDPADQSHGSGRGPHPSWWAAAGAVLIAVGASWWYFQAPTTPAPEGSRSPPGAPTQARPELPEAQPAEPRPGAPRSVVIPTLGVDANVLPIGAPGGTLTPPADPLVLGWWADGARPGDRRGSALITGHTVSTGGGALDDLETLARGDEVRVRTERGQLAYDVRRVRTYSKGRLAQRATEVFSQEAPGRLVLITCEDWNGSEYLSNVVVTAAPQESVPE